MRSKPLTRRNVEYAEVIWINDRCWLLIRLRCRWVMTGRSQVTWGKMLKLHHHLERPWLLVHSSCSMETWNFLVVLFLDRLINLPLLVQVNNQWRVLAFEAQLSKEKLKHWCLQALTRGQEPIWSQRQQALILEVGVLHSNESKRSWRPCCRSITHWPKNRLILNDYAKYKTTYLYWHLI